MTKIDHEKRNKEEKAKRNVDPAFVAGSNDQKTFQGTKKVSYWEALEKERVEREKKKFSRKQRRKGRKQCPQCAGWVSKLNLQRHIAAVHEEVECTICGMVLLGRRKLEKHLSKHSEDISPELMALTELPAVRKRKKKREKKREKKSRRPRAARR